MRAVATVVDKQSRKKPDRDVVMDGKNDTGGKIAYHRPPQLLSSVTHLRPHPSRVTRLLGYKKR